MEIFQNFHIRIFKLSDFLFWEFSNMKFLIIGRFKKEDFKDPDFKILGFLL